MDTKRLVIGMAVAMLIVFGWSYLNQYITKNHPEWVVNRPATQPATQPAGPVAPPLVTQTPTTPATPQATIAPAASLPAVEPQGLRVLGTDDTGPFILGSPDPADPAVRMAVHVSPRGAGLNSVILNDFKRVVDKPDRYIFQEPYGGPGDDESRSLATRSITIDGQSIDLLKADWVRTTAAPASSGEKLAAVTYRATIARGTTPIVHIDKTYVLAPRTGDEQSAQGYEVTVRHTVTNLTDQPIDAKLAMNGPVAPPVETDRMDDRHLIGGYNDAGNAKLTHLPLASITREAPTKDFSKDEDGRPLLWAGMSGVYFNAVVRSEPTEPIKIETATATGLNFDKPLFHHVILKLETNTFKLPAGASLESIDKVFFGPKQRKLLKSDYYSMPPLRYAQTLVMTSGPCGFCTFQWLVDGLYKLLSFFHFIFRDWGVAIICLVLIVRACLHPITKRAQINMSKMSKMGPEIERLKKKHGDNKDELNKAMMQFYKQQGATPILGCLPMILQMPIWIALYSALQSTFELRQSPFLAFVDVHFTWIKDLAQPDRLLFFPDKPISFFFIHIDALNVLPLIMGVVSFIQAKVMQKQQPPAVNEQQAQQQKMMVWMSLLLPVILYNGPAGLNLYIITSTAIGILESQIVRKHIKQREELEQRGAVIIDGPPPDDDGPPTGSVRRKNPTPEPAKTGGIAGWITKLQQKAEQMQQEQAKRKKR